MRLRGLGIHTGGQLLVLHSEVTAKVALADVPASVAFHQTLRKTQSNPADIAVQPKQRLRVQLYLSLLVLDSLCIVSSFMLAALARFGDPLAPAGLSLLPVLLPLFALTAFNLNSYGLEVLRKPRIGIFRASIALFSAVGIILLSAFFLKASAEYSRIILAAGTMLSFSTIFVGRFFLGRQALRWLGQNPMTEVVIADGVPFPRAGGATVIDAARAGLSPDATDPLMLDRLGSALAHVDRVLIACPPERRSLWALLLKGANIRGEVLAPECQEVGAIGIGRFGSRTTMAVSCGPLDLRSRALKRALDLAITVPVIVFLAPLMLLVACAIKLESRGPVFFTQRRLGRGNRLFMMLKFRSMRTDLCDADGKVSTMRDDDRITRVGRFIRASSIDELPQLLNVLRGEMSLVGPRPHALGSLAGSKLFWEVDERYWHRHACKPGITGLAQVRGFRGATHQSEDLENRLNADLEYLAGWTIFRDIAVLLRTFRVVIHHNAY